MLEAWLLLPVFALAYLLEGRGPGERWPIRRRAGQLVAGGAVAGVVSLAWMTAVTLDQLRADIRDREFRLVIAFSTRDPRLAWIARHCLRVQADRCSCGAGATSPSPPARPARGPQP